MTSSIIANSAPSVKPSPDRPYRVTCGGQSFWLSVIRTCGHDDLVPDEMGGYEFAARDDIPCGHCRQAAQRAGVATLIQYQPKQYQARGSGGAGSSRRPGEHRNRPRRTTRRDQAIAAAWELYSGADKFLAEVEAGQHHDAPHVIALAKKFRAQGLRQLRALGVVL